ncbi:trypsin-like serine protease [Qipengyuania sp. 6B39]|uniref:trypsin-like serine protease n=1 Tax=Qipengyuania proteolytica TaxID=2867239 RepID=UPI001C88F362|nr:trypsin-like serine protease [Qipengyuania proteolytica]MBX7495264.1 trypsin-like serine protease [Qipengyuania proteolytica]
MGGTFGSFFAAAGLWLALATTPSLAQVPTPEHVGLPSPPAHVEPAHVDEAKDARCRDGDAQACLELGMLYFDGENALINKPVAMRLLQNACAFDSAEGCLRLADGYMAQGYDLTSLSLAMDLVEKACGLGSPEACSRLGSHLYFGEYRVGQAIGSLGTARIANGKDPQRGEELMKDSCKSGFAPACAQLAELKLRPDRPKSDFAAGIAELEALCAKGDRAICTRAANLLTFQPQKNARLIERFRTLACDAGEASDCVVLAQDLAEAHPDDAKRDAVQSLLDRACTFDFEDCGKAEDFRLRPARTALCDGGDLRACGELGLGAQEGRTLKPDYGETGGRQLVAACLGGLDEFCKPAADYVTDWAAGNDSESEANKWRVLDLACDTERAFGCVHLASELVAADEDPGRAPPTPEQRRRAGDLFAMACEAGSEIACVRLRHFVGVSGSVDIATVDGSFAAPEDNDLGEERKPAEIANSVEEDTIPRDRWCRTSALFFRGELYTHEECHVSGGGINGIPLRPGQAPWQALLWRPAYLGQKLSAQQRVFCGGTLIARGWILTAAHCLKEMGGRRIKDGYLVRLGVYNPRKDEGISYPIVETIPHPAFNSRNYAFDIALVRYDYRKGSQPGETNSIRTIPLDDRSIAQRKIESGMDVYTYGWGWTKVDGYETSDKLLSMKMQLRSLSQCTQITAFRGERENAVLCAGGTRGEQACDGDSGGPLIYYEDADKVPKVIGVVSAGKKCGTLGEPSRYTRVAKVRGWIRQQMDRYPDWGF